MYGHDQKNKVTSKAAHYPPQGEEFRNLEKLRDRVAVLSDQKEPAVMVWVCSITQPVRHPSVPVFQAHPTKWTPQETPRRLGNV